MNKNQISPNIYLKVAKSTPTVNQNSKRLANVKQEKKSQYDWSLALEKYSGVNCGKLDRFNFNQSRGGGKGKHTLKQFSRKYLAQNS